MKQSLFALIQTFVKRGSPDKLVRAAILVTRSGENKSFASGYLKQAVALKVQGWNACYSLATTLPCGRVLQIPSLCGVGSSSHEGDVSLETASIDRKIDAGGLRMELLFAIDRLF